MPDNYSVRDLADGLYLRRLVFTILRNMKETVVIIVLLGGFGHFSQNGSVRLGQVPLHANSGRI